jgi:hypothetical protein
MATEQVHIAQQDIPAPGHSDPTVVAYRAGDVMHPEWVKQHAAFLKEAAQDGPELVKAVSPAKAGEESRRAMERAAVTPSPVQASTTNPSNAPG